MQLEERQALIGFITEIEASRERAKGETRHQSEIFKRAREKHLDPKAMRKVLQRRAMSKTDRESLDETIDLYEHALGSLAKAKEAVEGGMSRREAAEKFSVPRAALGHVARGSENAISDPPRDPEIPAGESGNTGGQHVTAPADSPDLNAVVDESPAGGEKPVTPAGDDHDAGHLTTEPEAARVAPPATDPADDWDELARVQRDLNKAFRDRRSPA
jgi:uncharacterized protein (UPF0335 family)